MKTNNLYTYLVFIFITNSIFAFNQSNIADQDFIDNADQFSNENGVRIYSDGKESVDLNSQYIPPEVIIEDDKLNSKDISVDKIVDSDNLGFSKVIKKQNKKSIGFSFSQMAKKSKKTTAENVAPKRVGFSFSQMAKNARKTPTKNIKVKP